MVGEMIGRTQGVGDNQGVIALGADAIVRERRLFGKHANVSV